MEEKKTSIICLLKILEENTDENHILTQPELLEMLNSRYGLDLDRRTLYKNITMLSDLGYEISDYKDNGKGYYLLGRQFEKSEVFLLANTIHSSNFIPKKASKELIDKLLDTQSRFVKNDFHNMVFIENGAKKENKEFFYNIEQLSEAIKEKKTIRFEYTKYNTSKQLVNKREEPYFISPYYLVTYLDRVYMVGKSDHHPDFTHYRVDRMKGIKLTDRPYVYLNKDEDPYQYSKARMYMYNGEIKRIAIKCDNSMLDDVIDTFGNDITIDSNGGSFTAYVSSSLQGMVYFALQYIEHMEVLEPQELRDQIKKALAIGQDKYR